MAERRNALLALTLASVFAVSVGADILVSNIGTNLASAAASVYEPEEVRVDDPRPCVAQSFGLPENGTSFWLTNVVLSMSHSGAGAVKAVLTLWSSMRSPGNSATPGLSMPAKPLQYLASRRFETGIAFNGEQKFTPRHPVAITAGDRPKLADSENCSRYERK